jgi:hypothetical protein
MGPPRHDRPVGLRPPKPFGQCLASRRERSRCAGRAEGGGVGHTARCAAPDRNHPETDCTKKGAGHAQKLSGAEQGQGSSLVDGSAVDGSAVDVGHGVVEGAAHEEPVKHDDDGQGRQSERRIHDKHGEQTARRPSKRHHARQPENRPKADQHDASGDHHRVARFPRVGSLGHPAASRQEIMVAERLQNPRGANR